MHFNAASFAIEERVVPERLEIDVGVKLAVDARQEIEIEFGGHARGIVVGAAKRVLVLDQVDTDQEQRTGAEHQPDMAEKAKRFIGLEIADGRAGEEADACQAGKMRRNIEWSGK